MSNVDFCKRNVRLWVFTLAGSSILVLAYAFLSAPGGENASTDFPGSTAEAGGSAEAMAPEPAPVMLAPAVAPLPAVAMPPSTAPGGATLVGGVPSFTSAVELVRPSVVNINATRQGNWPRQVAQTGPTFIDPFDGVPDKLIGNLAFESVGSGVIVDPAGYVLTNNHIVAGATSIVVSRFGRQEHLAARIVAAAREKDLALLKLEGTGSFPAVTFADSNKVEVGDWVLTVGNPFGLQQTVTSGIISGTQRSLAIDGLTYSGLLQTDAPINPGSSGGALTNASGQVIGITTAIYAPTGVFSGAGFAIPSNQASAFVARALAGSPSQQVAMVAMAVPTAGVMSAPPATAPAPWIGIGAIDMTPALADQLGYPHGDGAFVSSVVDGSPADEAGIERGDIITSIAGQLITGAAETATIVAGLSLDQRVPVTIWRKGSEKQVEFVPAAI